MVFLSDSALDSGLSYLTSNGDQVDICSQEPTTYTEATSTYSLGEKTSATVGSPQNGDTSGRKVTIAAITDGDVTATDTATHWALSKTTATAELLATQSLAASQAVTSGNTFSLGAIDIEIPDPS
jgi:hypothetical protein